MRKATSCYPCGLYFSYPARIRTWTKRAKISCATVTLPGIVCGSSPHLAIYFVVSSILHQSPIVTIGQYQVYLGGYLFICCLQRFLLWSGGPTECLLGYVLFLTLLPYW